MYGYLLFDWDGCVADTLSVSLAAYKIAFEHFNLSPTDEQIIDDCYGDWNGPLKLGIEDIDAFNAIYIPETKKRYIDAPLHKDAKEVLQRLKDLGKKLALVTTHKRDIAFPLINKYDLEKMFDTALYAEDVTRHKPDPEIVHSAIERLGGSHKESIIIGDSDNDLAAGNNAGIDTVLFYPPENEVFYKFEDLQKFSPTYSVKTFLEIKSLLESD